MTAPDALATFARPAARPSAMIYASALPRLTTARCGACLRTLADVETVPRWHSTVTAWLLTCRDFPSDGSCRTSSRGLSDDERREVNRQTGRWSARRRMHTAFREIRKDAVGSSFQRQEAAARAPRQLPPAGLAVTGGGFWLFCAAIEPAVDRRALVILEDVAGRGQGFASSSVANFRWLKLATPADTGAYPDEGEGLHGIAGKRSQTIFG